jgi:hypothetical protein
MAIRDFPGTENARMPFWSPDSRYIGFLGNGKLKKVELSGGAPQTVCDTKGTWDGAWGLDGTIIFSQYPAGPLLRVPAAGGEAKPLTELDKSRQETQHARPFFLPDGRHFLYLALSSLPDNNGVFVGSLDSKNTKRLMGGTSNAIYAAVPSGGGFLLFERAGALMAQSFDPAKLELAGEPVPIAEQVAPNMAGGSSFSVSQNGVLAYRVGATSVTTQLVWFDRSGKRLETVADPADYTSPALSPDEKKVAVGRRDTVTQNRDIWVYDLVRGTASRLTFDPADELNPTWSPDGTRVAYTSERKGPRDLYQRMASGAGEEEVLLASKDRKSVEDWSQDGRFLIYNIGGVAATKDDLWVLPLTGDRKPFPYLTTPFRENQGHLSPNGRWMAYRSDESGKYEVYVQAFPPSGGKWQISNSGGGEPSWRRDGKELFYTNDRKIFAVPVKTEGSTFEAGIPAVLFEAPMPQIIPRNRYVAAANGQRFLVNTAVDDKSTPTFTVVLNWMAALKR